MFAAAISGRYDLIAAEGGWGSGKSFGAVFCVKALAVAYPGTRWAIVTDTGPRLGRVVQPICEHLLGREGWIWRADPRKNYWESPQGSRIYLVAYHRPSTRAGEANPLEGMDLNGAAVDECQAVLAEVLAKLVGRTRRKHPGLTNLIILVGLPMGSAAWWMRAAADNPRAISFNASSFANRANLSPEFFEKAKQHLDPDEYEAMILGKPAPPKDRVYNHWSDEQWPAGNLLADFVYDPGRPTTLAIDFGLRYPAVLFIQSVERALPDGRVITLDVVFDELAPDRILVAGLVEQVLSRAWPRSYAATAPEGAILFDELAVDPAGGATNEQTGVTDLQLLSRSPEPHPDGLGRGLGYYPRTETSPARRNIKTGIEYTKRLICTATGVRRLVCTTELWERGEAVSMKRRSFTKSLQEYKWPDRGLHKQGPTKGGQAQPDHHMDALRYYVINFRPDLAPPRPVRVDLDLDLGLPDLLGDR